MGIKTIFTLLKMLLTPNLLKVMKGLKHYVRFNFIHAALDSGLLYALEKPKSFEELTRELSVKNTELLRAILDVGLSLGELGRVGDRFKLKGSLSKTVITESGDALGALIQANATYYNSAYRHLATRLQSNEKGDDLARIGDLVARVSKIQEPVIKRFVSDTVRGHAQMRLLEIGCGSGRFLKTAYTANKATTGLGMDYDEHVVKQARENMVKWGLADRFEITAGDIRTYDFSSMEPFDLITMYNVLYYLDHEERVAVLEKLKSALSPQGRVAIITTTQSKGRDLFAANLNLVNCSLKGVTALPELQSLTDLFTESGFATVSSAPILPGSTVYSILVS